MTALAPLALAAFAAAAPAAEAAVAARVNGEPLPAARVAHRVAELRRDGVPPPAGGSLEREALEALVDEELLWQEARAAGRVASDAEVDAAVAPVRARFPSAEAFRAQLAREGFTEAEHREEVRRRLSVEAMARQATARAEPTEADVRAHWAANRERFLGPERARVRQLVVLAPAGSDRTVRADARRKIEALLAEARKPGVDFAALARRRSEDGAARDGGDLGVIARGATVKPIDDAVFALAPGQVSGVVETAAGFHVLKVEERLPGAPLPFDEVQATIRGQLYARAVAEALDRHVAALRAKARIEPGPTP